MKRQARPVQDTIRGVPPEMDRVLRADFSDVAGRWDRDPAFDEIVAEQRQIDWDKWK
jgi:hypothetical protein